MRFAHPWFLLFLMLLPVLAAYKRKKRTRSVRFSDVGAFREITPSASVRYRNLPLYLRLAAIALVVIALARPQTGQGFQVIDRHGIDIMLLLDTSTSMNIMDITPTRLDAAKKAMLRFIENRRNDRIGLIAFAGTSFTRCPLTLDYAVLKTFIAPLTSGMVEDGTAIGMAIANGVNRLKDSPAKTKIVILLTDGVNNRGLIDPHTAVELAVAEKIKVYTIGVGKSGVFYQEVNDPRFGKRRVAVRSEIDETLLRQIAKKTGAKYYAAQNEQELVNIYDEIDRLEKTKIKSRVYYEYTEWFAPLTQMALILLLAEWLLSRHFLRRLPE